MDKKRTKLLILMIFILTMLISTNIFASSEPIRLSGEDRYETSSKIALNGWTQCDYAVMALGEDYPDALCAAPLAGKYKAPILLTQTNSIPASTLSTINQLQIKNIFIVGGIGVISQAVQDQLSKLGITTTRLAGKTRYDTDIAVAKQLGSVSQIAVVTGEDYADALSIAPIAVKLNIPIIIVEQNGIPQSVIDYVASQNISKTYVIGKGTSIDNEIGLPNVTEINGIDKYARNIAIISAFKNSLDFSTIYIATGENFADALSGSALAGINGNPLLLVGGDITNEKNLLQLVAPNANIKILGGVGAIADSTVVGIDNTTTSSSITVITPSGTSEVSEIYILSTKLTKTGTNTATFTYKLLNSSGKEITKEIPASQIKASTSRRATITLDPSAGTGTITYNSSTDIDEEITISLISNNGIKGVATLSSGDMPRESTSDIYEIGFNSSKLKKIAANKNTFEYGIRNKFAFGITNAVPASQIKATASLDSTITLDPVTGTGTITYKSPADMSKPITISLVDRLTGITINKILYADESESTRIGKISMTTLLTYSNGIGNPALYGAYEVYDQYGNNITQALPIGTHLIFKSQYGTATGNNGTIMVKDLKDVFLKQVAPQIEKLDASTASTGVLSLSQVGTDVITITDTTSGISTNVTLSVSYSTGITRKN